jgi:hypothetical protein
MLVEATMAVGSVSMVPWPWTTVRRVTVDGVVVTGQVGTMPGGVRSMGGEMMIGGDTGGGDTGGGVVVGVVVVGVVVVWAGVVWPDAVGPVVVPPAVCVAVVVWVVVAGGETTEDGMGTCETVDGGAAPDAAPVEGPPFPVLPPDARIIGQAVMVPGGSAGVLTAVIVWVSW